MNALIEKYLAEQKEQLAAERQKQEEKRQLEENAERRKQQIALMESLGIYEEGKEYTDTVFLNKTSAARLGFASEEVDGRERFYAMKRVYPELTDEEYEALLEVQRERRELGLDAAAGAKPASPVKPSEPKAEAKPEAPLAAQPVEYKISTGYSAPASFGATLMKVLAFIVWIGGVIASIVLARVPTGYRDEVEFHFGLFLGYAAAFFIVGATYWAIGELFANVAEIKGGISDLRRAEIVPQKKTTGH